MRLAQTVRGAGHGHRLGLAALALDDTSWDCGAATWLAVILHMQYGFSCLISCSVLKSANAYPVAW